MGTDIIQNVIAVIMLLASFVLILAASILFWVRICYKDVCTKRRVGASLVLGATGWILYLLVMVPVM